MTKNHFVLLRSLLLSVSVTWPQKLIKKRLHDEFYCKEYWFFFRWVCCLKKVPKPIEAVTRVVKLNPDIIVVSVTGLHTLQHQHILSTSSINYSRSTSTYLLPFSFPKFQSWLALLKSVWKYYTNFRFNFFFNSLFFQTYVVFFFVLDIVGVCTFENIQQIRATTSPSWYALFTTLSVAISARWKVRLQFIEWNL